MRGIIAYLGIVGGALSAIGTGLYHGGVFVHSYFAKATAVDTRFIDIERRIHTLEAESKLEKINRLNWQIDRYEREAKQRSLTTLEERQLRKLREERDALVLKP